VVCDEDVDGSEFPLHCVDEPFGGARIGQVRLQRGGTPAARADLSGDLVRSIGGTPVVHADARTRSGEPVCQRPADPAACTGHQCNAAAEIGHRRSAVITWRAVISHRSGLRRV
jgi:hypothetical protein